MKKQARRCSGKIPVGRGLGLFLLAATLVGGSATAQTQPDYLTPEEITLVRDTQEPDKRILLFLEFAELRLARFEEAAKPREGHYEDLLRDRLNDFINAIDDSAASLELALERGGVDLRKTRVKLLETVNGFVTRVEAARKAQPEILQGDLRFDVEDSLMAMQDLLDLGQKIPDEPMAPRFPQRTLIEGEDQPPIPGRPTLKRRGDDEEKKPR